MYLCSHNSIFFISSIEFSQAIKFGEVFLFLLMRLMNQFALFISLSFIVVALNMKFVHLFELCWGGFSLIKYKRRFFFFTKKHENLYCQNESSLYSVCDILRDMYHFVAINLSHIKQWFRCVNLLYYIREWKCLRSVIVYSWSHMNSLLHINCHGKKR
jgi:hypothetical protein